MFNRSSTSKIDEAVARSINFEVTVADLARRSERRAWWVAFAAIAMALILASGYFFMLPLKEKVPYLVMADAYTGTSTVARLNDDALNRRISTSEAINRSNVAHFVLARESYDAALINLRDWATVLTMASPGVAAAYTALHAPNNANSPYNTYGRDKAIRVKILSIVLVGGNPNTGPKGATVRFQRSLYDKQTGASHTLDSKIATLEFTYKANLKMDEQYRIENPLGFQVTSYRVDSDYATAPSDEAPDAAEPGDNTSAVAPAPNGSAAALPASPIPEHTGAEMAPQSNTQGASR